MDGRSGTYSGQSLAEALSRAAAALSVSPDACEYEVLLGSDAEGHVLIRARIRPGESPLVAFSKDILVAMGASGSVALDEGRRDQSTLSIVSEDLVALGKKHPDVPGALAHLLKRAAEKLDPGRQLDVSIVSRQETRDEVLAHLARLAVERCRRYGRPVALPPMNPYERRMIHVAIRESSELGTESTGFGAKRRIVVLPYDSAGGGSAEGV
ncbi:MAG: R3H domain-containing nucleic acid-binding protein [Acidobacteriota bacterium]